MVVWETKPDERLLMHFRACRGESAHLLEGRLCEFYSVGGFGPRKKRKIRSRRSRDPNVRPRSNGIHHHCAPSTNVNRNRNRNRNHINDIQRCINDRDKDQDKDNKNDKNNCSKKERATV